MWRRPRLFKIQVLSTAVLPIRLQLQGTFSMNSNFRARQTSSLLRQCFSCPQTQGGSKSINQITFCFIIIRHLQRTVVSINQRVLTKLSIQFCKTLALILVEESSPRVNTVQTISSKQLIKMSSSIKTRESCF